MRANPHTTTGQLRRMADFGHTTRRHANQSSYDGLFHSPPAAITVCNPPACEPTFTRKRSVDFRRGAFIFGLSCRYVVCALFICTTRGCREMWIENRVIHIVGITVWITHVIIHILGIILWIAWGQSAGHTRSTCINLVKVLCATIPAGRTPTPPALRPVICKRAPPSRPCMAATTFGIIDAGVRNSESDGLSGATESGRGQGSSADSA